MISRRIVIRNGGLALVSLAFAPSFLTRTVAAAANSRRKVLVAIFQRGAADGLNMVVPYGEHDYYASRPTINISRPGSGDLSALDLDGFFAFHPSLAPLQKLYARRELAIVHACGSPDNTRSHFDAQDYMETATPGRKSTPDGWLNRYLQARRTEEHSSFRAVSLTSQLPRMLQGREEALAISQIGQFGIRGTDTMSASLEAQYAQTADSVLGGTAREAFDAIKTMRVAMPQNYQPANGAEYPRSPFGQSMLQIGQLVKSDLGLEVAFTEIGGWDNHVNQGAATGQLAARLDDLGRGIAALVTDLGDRMADVVIMTMSEFGRTARQNGNGGTDHGHATALFVIGGAVHGGKKVFGRWPGLEPEQLNEGRDLALTTDFRAVFGEVISKHLGAKKLESVFPGFENDKAKWLGLI
jgi:uncharacterized protein (DUF1501 family)